MSYFVTPYTIHFDDTMAYGSHHFLTGFKFQCEARESFLYGDLIFDQPGVKQALDSIHLFTADAYSRNLSPTFLGDRIAIFITLEEWGRVSARFCYRVLGAKGQPICAGFQTMIVSDAKTGNVIPLPEPLRQAFDKWREITEPETEGLFRDRVLAGTDSTMAVFDDSVRQLTLSYLSDRYPHPRIIRPGESAPVADAANRLESAKAHLGYSKPAIPDVVSRRDAPVAMHHESHDTESRVAEPEVWAFPGQGTCDPELLVQRTSALRSECADEFERVARVASELLGCDASVLFDPDPDRFRDAMVATPGLDQVAIHLQSVLGARLRRRTSDPALLMGHSFGEIAAMNVAGCFDLPTGVAVVCHRVRAVEQFGPPDGAMFVAKANRQRVAEEIAVLGLQDSVIAGRNHEGLTAVSGPRTQLKRLSSALNAAGIDFIPIASPTSFHNPLLRQAADDWYRALCALPMHPPSEAVYSPIGRRSLGAKDHLPTILASHFLRPFDLQGALDDLYAGGFRRFVDCGSSGVLERLLVNSGPPGITVERVSAVEVSPPSTPAANHDPKVLPHAQTETEYERPRPTVAIVGQGCLLPGGATSPSELFGALEHGRSGIRDKRVGDDWWERDFYSEELLPDRSTSPLAGLVNDEDLTVPDGFDPATFDAFSRLQKILCKALAPCAAAIRKPARVVCYLGTTADGFEDQDGFAVLRYAGINSTDDDVAARLGRTQSAQEDPYTAVKAVVEATIGDAEVTLVDAACASSLYAVGLGMQTLESGEADIVLAGGVFCPGPGNNCLFSQFRGLTATGCRPFDANADGVVFAEGSAVVALQREADAVADGQAIHGIVRGFGLSSDGRSPSANVPQTPGQLHALQRCYENYGIAPSSIEAVEAHGTSTPVGDSTELRTLNAYYSGRVTKPLHVHSLKGLLGHTGWAAGTASIIAATEMLRRRQFPAQATHATDSEALRESSDTLRVARTAVPLRASSRIAVDGFGFGGSNAHVVVESPGYSAVESSRVSSDATHAEYEPVIVGWHQIQPTVAVQSSDGSNMMRFDREAVRTVEGVILLPDLADDMDVSQSLALAVVGGSLDSAGISSDEMRSETGIVLALGGKTERAVEATARVLSPRLARSFSDHPELKGLESAIQRARPSGPYTLQCMMPNVSAGRAALCYNLNGPNFVVDAAERSLDAAFDAARLLLQNGERGGTRFVVTSAIDANRWPVPGSESDRNPNEYAAAFVVTTRREAERNAMPILASVGELEQRLAETAHTEEKIAVCVQALDRNQVSVAPAAVAAGTSLVAATSERDEFPIHTPIWIESPLTGSTSRDLSNEVWGVFCWADQALVPEVLQTLPGECREFRVFCVGPDADEVARAVNHPYVSAFTNSSHDAVLAQLGAMNADLLLAVDRPSSWAFDECLDRASQNSISEAMFLAMSQFADRMHDGRLEAWAVFAASWDGQIHPATGAAAGLFKSTQREIPAAHLGVLASSRASIKDVLAVLRTERSHRPEENEKRDLEVVHDGDVRLVRRLRVVDPALDAAPKPPVELSRESVVVATGGARGVTAIMAEALLQDHQCTFIALGRSALERGPDNFDSAEVEREFYERFVAENPNAGPPEMRKRFEAARARWEAYQTIEGLSSIGGSVRYLSVDVTDQAAVDRAIAEIVAEFGRVDLLIHGAGIQWSKKIQDRSLWEYRKTFDVKVNGLRNLVRSCQRHVGRTVPTHILTSAYSIFGNDGQHDYGAANQAMDRLCELTQTDRTVDDWTSIAWSAWDGIGMTRGSEYKALASSRNLALLGPSDGQRVFRHVMTGRTRSAINVPLSQPERANYLVRTVPASRHLDAGHTIELAVSLNDMDCLPFHKARGTMTVPGAWTLDYMVRAVLQRIDERYEFCTIEDMQFLKFVRVPHEQNPELRVIVQQHASGFHAWMIGDVVNPDGVKLVTDVVFAQAEITPGSPNASVTLNGLAHAGEDIHRFNDPYCAGDYSVDLSGPFDCLPEVEISPSGRRAFFTPQASVNWGGAVPAMLLDASLRVAGMHVVPGALHVPVRIDRVVVPIGMTTDSSAASGWKIRSCAPNVMGDDVLCRRVEVTDSTGALKLWIDGALVTRIR